MGLKSARISAVGMLDTRVMTDEGVLCGPMEKSPIHHIIVDLSRNFGKKRVVRPQVQEAF